MTSAKQLARYLIKLTKDQMQGVQPEEFDITPLKLQKLLYYCQGYTLAMTGKPAFDEEIEAWRLGPVVGSVYQEYKKYEGRVIPVETDESEAAPEDAVAAIARLIVSEKGKYSGYQLSRATHKERPYIESYEGAYVNAEIPRGLMREYFAEELQKREEDYDDEDEAWERVGEPVSKSELEALLEEL